MPSPKDLVKLEDYKKRMSIIAKERGYGLWMRGRISTFKGHHHSYETKQLLSAIFKVKAKELGFGKWMKGRLSPYMSNANRQRKGKSYVEIYGDRAIEECSKRKIGNRKHWDGLPRKEHRHKATWEYTEWRTKVFERDNYTCQICGTRGCFLNAHHIKPWAKYPELRYIVSNGITVCKGKCHSVAACREREEAFANNKVVDPLKGESNVHS